MGRRFRGHGPAEDVPSAPATGRGWLKQAPSHIAPFRSLRYSEQNQRRESAASRASSEIWAGRREQRMDPPGFLGSLEQRMDHPVAGLDAEVGADATAELQDRAHRLT